jgi:hypothetical protein
MVEGRQDVRLAAKPSDAVGVLPEGLRQHLDRGLALEPRVTGAIDLAHAAGAEGGGDLVRPDLGPWPQRHRTFSS